MNPVIYYEHELDHAKQENVCLIASVKVSLMTSEFRVVRSLVGVWSDCCYCTRVVPYVRIPVPGIEKRFIALNFSRSITFLSSLYLGLGTSRDPPLQRERPNYELFSHAYSYF